MRTFRFALQPALDAASAREREAAVANGRARAEVDAARAVVALLDARASEARALVSARTASAWIAADWYLGRLRDVRARRELESSVAFERAARARELFEHRRRGARTLELLRERRFAEHRARAAMLAAAELEESNARSHHRTCDEAAAAGFLKDAS